MMMEAMKNKAEHVKVVSTKVLWKIPVENRERLKLLEIIEFKKRLSCAFRKWELCENKNISQTKKHS